MHFYKQLTYWKNSILSSTSINTKNEDDEDEERKLKKMRVMGEELGVVRMLLGKRIETMCGEFVTIDLQQLFSFYSITSD